MGRGDEKKHFWQTRSSYSRCALVCFAFARCCCCCAARRLSVSCGRTRPPPSTTVPLAVGNPFWGVAVPSYFPFFAGRARFRTDGFGLVRSALLLGVGVVKREFSQRNTRTQLFCSCSFSFLFFDFSYWSFVSLVFFFPCCFDLPPGFAFSGCWRHTAHFCPRESVH